MRREPHSDRVIDFGDRANTPIEAPISAEGRALLVTCLMCRAKARNHGISAYPALTDFNFVVLRDNWPVAERQHIAGAGVWIELLGKCWSCNRGKHGQGGQKLLHDTSPVIEVSREETAKRPELFLKVENPRLISDNVFMNGD